MFYSVHKKEDLVVCQSKGYLNETDLPTFSRFSTPIKPRTVKRVLIDNSGI